MRRKHADKDGTSYRLAEVSPVTGKASYDEVGLSAEELKDLHTYASYLQSEKAKLDGVTSPEAQAALQRISPYGQVTLERDDGVKITTKASSVPAGTTVTMSFSEPEGVTLELGFSPAEARAKTIQLLNMATALKKATKSDLYLWLDFLSGAAAVELSRKTMSGSFKEADMPQAILDSLLINIDEALAEADFDSTALESAIKELKADQENPEKLRVVLEELSKYNELFDQTFSNGVAKTRDYRVLGFLEMLPLNQIQATGNPESLLDLYDNAFPGVKAAMLDHITGGTFTGADFLAALQGVMKELHGQMIAGDDASTDQFLLTEMEGVFTPGDKVTRKQLLTEAAGMASPSTTAHDVNEIVKALAGFKLFLPGSFIPERDRASQIREKKRIAEIERRKAEVNEVVDGIGKIRQLISDARAGDVNTLDAWHSLLEKALPKRPWMASVRDRIKAHVSGSRFNVGAFLAAEKKLLAQMGITIHGSDQTFFENYLRYLHGGDFASSDPDPARLREVF